MLQLNRRAAELAQQVDFPRHDRHHRLCPAGARLTRWRSQSEVRFRFHFEQLPFLDGAKDYADLWLFPGGTCNNQRTFEEHVTFNGLRGGDAELLLFTPETSGGLLIALPPAEADRLESSVPRGRTGGLARGRGG